MLLIYILAHAVNTSSCAKKTAMLKVSSLGLIPLKHNPKQSHLGIRYHKMDKIPWNQQSDNKMFSTIAFGYWNSIDQSLKA